MLISAKDSQVGSKDEEGKNGASMQQKLLSLDELQNEPKSPGAKKRSTKMIYEVKDQSSSDDEIKMDDLGQELTANIVRVTLKKNPNTQCDIGITERLSNMDL